MTERERDEMQHRRFDVFQGAGWRCVVCGAPATQIAHRIPQTKANLQKYGRRIIHHRHNLAAVCSLACNDSVLIGGRPIAREALVARIREELDT